MKKALIVVDVQNDFCKGGKLEVPQGDEVVEVINELLPKFETIIFTKDNHPADMECFASNYVGKKQGDKYTNTQGNIDVLWNPHCIENTIGAEIHKEINFNLIKGDFYIFNKGTEKNYHPYSGFGADGLLEFLKERNIEELYVVGLATDYCVKQTAIDAVNNGFYTKVIWDATRGIADDLSDTMYDMFNSGITVVDYEWFKENS